jgi:hypothetical protein
MHTGARCPVCKDRINKGDSIVCIDDKWLHEECEASDGAWEHFPPASPALQLHELMAQRGLLIDAFLTTKMGVDDLPEAVREAFDLAMTTEGMLWRLLSEIAAEHTESVS